MMSIETHTHVGYVALYKLECVTCQMLNKVVCSTSSLIISFPLLLYTYAPSGAATVTAAAAKGLKSQDGRANVPYMAALINWAKPSQARRGEASLFE